MKAIFVWVVSIFTPRHTPVSNGQFYSLAVAVAAGRGTPAEQAKLDAILAAEPARVGDFKKVQDNTAFLNRILPIIQEVTLADEVPLGDKHRREFMAYIAERRAAMGAEPVSAAEAIPPQVLTPRQMNTQILKIIGQKPMDGHELCSQLRRMNIRLVNHIDAAIYRILEDLEVAGLLDSEVFERRARMLTVYRLTDDGRVLAHQA